jgi:hypothetical protein
MRADDQSNQTDALGDAGSLGDAKSSIGLVWVTRWVTGCASAGRDIGEEGKGKFQVGRGGGEALVRNQPTSPWPS